MLKIKEMRDTLKQISAATGVPIHEIWVGAGGAMVAHGLRSQTDDIDIGCSPHYFRVLSKHYGVTPVMLDGAGGLPPVQVLLLPDLKCDIHEEFIIPERCLVEKQGIWVYSLEALLAQKRALNRPKDIKDINLLTRYIALLTVNPPLAALLNND